MRTATAGLFMRALTQGTLILCTLVLECVIPPGGHSFSRSSIHQKRELKVSFSTKHINVITRTKFKPGNSKKNT